MQKLFSRIALLLTSAACFATMYSCSDDDTSITPTPEPPTLNVSVSEIQRTKVDFSIMSAGAADYAYIVKETDPSYVPTAEDLFKEGSIGLLEDGTASISTVDVEGGKQFDLYVAVRKINPYVYSEVKKVELNTDLAYTDIITLDRIAKTDFTYHVEMPEGASKMKHVVIKQTDFEAIKSILAMFGDVSFEGYLEVFGHEVTESTDITLDKYATTALYDDIDVHYGTDYYLMGGVINEDGKVDPEQFKCIEFQTRPTETSPYDFEVGIETTSTSANIHITPDPEFKEYRVLVDKKSEFDFWRREGEAQMRNVVIGHWDDQRNQLKRVQNGEIDLQSLGLVPNTNYVIGIVGFDDQFRDKVKFIDFRTGEPTGPRPEITITENKGLVTAPWNSAAYTVNIKNASTVRYGCFMKSQVDQVLANGSTISGIIENNGQLADDAAITAMLSADGYNFEIAELNPETEYLFGVYAVNPEYVSECKYVTFTTEALPQIGGATRQNMPGHYIASTTDEEGNTVTFPVTIATGVNDATTAEYSSLNRLVALGFGPSDQFPYKSPTDITADDPNQAYGPKWFIEFTENGISVPSASGKSWTMGALDGSLTYMKGYGVRETANGPRAMEYDDSFVVEVSDDGNTITVKGTFHDIGTNGGTCYPAMLTPGSGWFSPNVYHFRCYSDLVLTRQVTNSAYVHRGKIKTPKTVKIMVGDNSVKSSRQSAAGQFKSK